MTERDEFIRRLTDAGFGEVEAGRLFDNDAEVHAIRAALAEADRERESLRADLATVERERDRYRVALKQYSDWANWQPSPSWPRDKPIELRHWTGDGEGPELALRARWEAADATDWRFLHDELAATQRRDRERLDAARDALSRIPDCRTVGAARSIARKALMAITNDEEGE